MSFLKIKMKTLILGTLFIVLSVGIFFSIPSKSTTAVIPFGGSITSAFYCPCSGNIKLLVSDPVGGAWLFQPGVSLPYAYGQVYRAGPWTLGNWVSGGRCLVFSFSGCSEIPVQGTILEVGTSI